MHVIAKIPVVTIPCIGGGEIKWSGEGDEFKCDIVDTL
jgi:hypothetical protein